MHTFTITKSTHAPPTIDLPAPSIDGGLPLINALQNRRSYREFSDEAISDQQLSDMLWAANGINKRVEFREQFGMRTAPSARNNQEIDMYVFLSAGIYLYDAVGNQLRLVREGDYRAEAGLQPFYEEAPLALCLVADFKKMGSYTDDQKAFYSGIDAGYISQNIYLYCASAGLATVACGRIDRERLHELLKLDDAKAILSHPVGKNG